MKHCAAYLTEHHTHLEHAATVQRQAEKGQDYNNKLIEFTQVNTNTAFEYIQKLFSVKSPSEFVEVSNEQARQQFETLAEQTKQLATPLTSAEPLKTGFTKAFNRAA